MDEEGKEVGKNEKGVMEIDIENQKIIWLKGYYKKDKK